MDHLERKGLLSPDAVWPETPVEPAAAAPPANVAAVAEADGTAPSIEDAE